jgi:hypothetical protein
MKTTKLFLLAAVAPMVVASLAVSHASAMVATYKASAGPAANPDANAGTVNVWNVQLTSGDAGQNGSFQGDSAANGDGSNHGSLGAGGSAWALYANNFNTARADALILPLVGRNLTLAGDSISLDFDNGFIDSGGAAGFTLHDAIGNSLFIFRFRGGTSNYEVVDAVGALDTGVPFTDNGFKVTLTLTDSAGGYTLSMVNSQTPNPISTIISSTMAQALIGEIRVFNVNAGSGTPANVYFDNLVITAIPEASPVFLIPLAVATTFLGSLGVRRCGRRAA